MPLLVSLSEDGFYRTRNKVKQNKERENRERQGKRMTGNYDCIYDSICETSVNQYSEAFSEVNVNKDIVVVLGVGG